MSTGARRLRGLPDALRDVLGDARALGFLGPGPLEPHLAHAQAFARVVAGACSAATAFPGVAGQPLGAPGVAVAPPSEATAPGAPEPAVVAPGPASVLDLGSGGGLPGLVLAVAWPTTTVTLVDAQQRRTAFLADAAQRLGVATRVRVVEGRAESLGRSPELRGRLGVVVARSFGRPAVTAECAAPFLEVGGILVVSEPPGDAGPVAPVDRSTGPGQDAARWPETGLRALGMGPASPVVDEFHFVVVHQLEPCPERFPRRVGLPAKRPLF